MALTVVADMLAAGELTSAAATIRQALEAEPGMRGTGALARLHREVIQHQGAITRLERDAAGRRISREAEQADRARLTAMLLDVLDEMARLERELGIAFRVEPVGWVRPKAVTQHPAPDIADHDAASVGLRADALTQPTGTMATPPDIFLSYARPDRALVVELAVTLQAQGFSCWFDHLIAGGARFREAINAQLDAARAVVVLWSEHSIASDWVLYEADRAHKAGKLIPLRATSLALDQVPAPYPAVLNILVLGDDDALTWTLKGLGLLQTQ